VAPEEEDPSCQRRPHPAVLAPDDAPTSQMEAARGEGSAAEVCQAHAADHQTADEGREPTPVDREKSSRLRGRRVSRCRAVLAEVRGPRSLCVRWFRGRMLTWGLVVQLYPGDLHYEAQLEEPQHQLYDGVPCNRHNKPLGDIGRPRPEVLIDC
jgi:hypothetical protein